MNNLKIDTKGLSKPLTKLVEVVADGIGGLYAPIGTVRQAKADAKARLIHADSDEKITTIQERYENRIQYREECRQENIENIVSTAANELSDSVSSDDVDSDWTTEFFNHAQDISDKEMQNLWAKILAGEVTQPSTYSKRTLQFLKTMDKWEADAFSQLCSFAVYRQDWPIIFSDALKSKIQEKLGNGDYFAHFTAIGLISSEISAPSIENLVGQEIKYFDNSYKIEAEDLEPDRKINFPYMISVRQFSVIGAQLAKISGAEKIDGLVEELAFQLDQQHKHYNIKFLRT